MMKAQRLVRFATLVFTLLTLLLIGLGTYVIFGAWSAGAGTEAPGDAWLLFWPLVWLLSGVSIVVVALLVAQRLKVAVRFVAWVWGGDILLWFIGLPLASLLTDMRDSLMLVAIGAFDIAAFYVIGRFLLQGGPRTIWGR